jgi:anthranilate synthase/aminodeoxychorismate synthase-like glutamine amidotransferase
MSKNPVVLLLDNYDSFTYNLVQYFSELGAIVKVFKNDEVSLSDLQQMEFTHLVISPGPGSPEVASDFGVCTEAIEFYFDKIPVLGVCLGHQGIASIYGAKIVKAPEVLHGVRSKICKTFDSKLLKGLHSEFEVMRYHSLIVESESLPENFRVIAKSLDKELIMAYEHTELPVYGVQFHPESIGTTDGHTILSNFLNVDGVK